MRYSSDQCKQYATLYIVSLPLFGKAVTLKDTVFNAFCILPFLNVQICALDGTMALIIQRQLMISMLCALLIAWFPQTVCNII